MTQYVIGVDFGTDSVRSVLVNAGNGKELASSVFYYPRWKQGLYCNAATNQFRQHPLDYMEGLEQTIKECLQKAGNEAAKNVKAISVDTTGSSPVAVDDTGTPLALLPGFENNPNAMFVLWKDHTAVAEAGQINEHAAKFSTSYLQYVGGIYSSEWFWAKLLHVLREDEAVRNNIASWVEHCDWIPFLLSGGNDIRQMKRGVCSAGHKALWAKEFNGLRGQCLRYLLQRIGARSTWESARYGRRGQCGPGSRRIRTVQQDRSSVGALGGATGRSIR